MGWISIKQGIEMALDAIHHNKTIKCSQILRGLNHELDTMEDCSMDWIIKNNSKPTQPNQ